MRTILCLLSAIIAITGCAKVQVQVPKDPIKVDISMRLDVYQHVEKDIDAIENIVTGAEDKPQSKFFPAIFPLAAAEAYAEEALSSEVEQAAFRRRDRRAALVDWQRQGVIVENRSGLVELRDPQKADASLNGLVRDENNDRMIIYQEIAQKNGTTVAEVQKIYAKRLQEDAPAGTPIEVLEADGTYQWKVK